MDSCGSSSQLITLRRGHPALAHPDRNALDVNGDETTHLVTVRSWNGASHVCSIFNFNRNEVAASAILPDGVWKTVLDSSHEKWNGPGSLLSGTIAGDHELRMRPHAAALFVQG